MLREKKPA